MNHVILIGRLCADPSLKYTPNGVAVANFTLAVDRAFSKDKEADFIPIITWQKLAETCANHLRKGRLAAVEGRLQIRSYEKDGQKRYASEVVARSVQFLDRAQQSQGQEQSVDEINLDDLPF